MESSSTGVLSAEIRDQLLALARKIDGAKGWKDIMEVLKEGVPALVKAERVIIYGLDIKNQQLYSLMRSDAIPGEIRIPRTFSSVAGFCALSKQPVNVRNVYDPEELKKINSKLNFDPALDEGFGGKTKEIYALPIRYDRFLLGVFEVANKTQGSVFNSDDQTVLTEISRLLGVALYNYSQASKQNQSGKYSYLINNGTISPEKLEEASEEARDSMKDLAVVLIEDFDIPKEEVGKSLALFYNTGFFSWDGETLIPEDLLDRIPSDFLLNNVCLPLKRSAGVTLFAIDDPRDLSKVDHIKFLGISPRYEFWVGLSHEIKACINASFGLSPGTGGSEQVDDILADLEATASGAVEDDLGEDGDVEDSDNVVVRLANKIISDAYYKGASDIHVEPYGTRKDCVIRYRIDGDCQKVMDVPGHFKQALVSRLKIMAKLDIAERQKPQDGKIRFKGSMGVIELRVATIPTTNHNEDIVMRILAASEPMPVETLGMTERNMKCLEQIVNTPYGIFLCVGPTGSGKTTTLHACIGHINTEDRKIWSVEDPVEITQVGLRQVQINTKKGLDFANAMRAFLRADPDVIMVGEMRDHETAHIGIEASLTGHLVFSTLHTNSAPETITRLLDMKLDPFNFADALLGILAQRLARTLCGKCKKEEKPELFEYQELEHLYGEEAFRKLNVPYDDNFKLMRPVGCKVCDDKGYKGRMGLHEMLLASDKLKKIIALGGTVDEIRAQSIKEGMTTLLQDGILKVLSGNLDLQAVRKVCLK